PPFLLNNTLITPCSPLDLFLIALYVGNVE
ncbi:MAG: hypothetical protein ACI9T9_002971, partial [Oleiphilaceae bacterium]